MIILNEKFKSPLYLQIYRQFREKIISGQFPEASKKVMGKEVMIHGINAGLHITLEFKDKVSEIDLIQKAKNHGIAVYPVSKCWIRKHRYEKEMILLGYSGMDERDIIDGVKLLNKAWFGG